jgi:hypothetical protein
LVGAVVPIPIFPPTVTATSLACCATDGIPVVGLSFAPSILNTPCGFDVLIPTYALKKVKLLVKRSKR